MQFISDYSNINNVTVLSNNINPGTHMGFPQPIYIIKLSACHHPLINLDHKTLGNNNNSNCFEVCVCK